VGRPFKRPRGFDLARAWQESARRFEAELRNMQARVRVSPRCRAWLGNARIHAVVLPVPEHTSPVRPGWREALMSVESIEHGARQLLAYGADIEVLAPVELRAEMHRQARLLVAAHQDAVMDDG
jgi:predicted DNA-binding transcriptional regulator YafY